MPSFNSAHFREKVRDILKQYTKEYKAVGEELINSIENKIKHGASVSRAVSSALAETAFFNVNKDSIVNAIYLAACAGYGVLPEILTDQSEQLIKGKLLSTYWNSDKMPLSKRLHQINSNMRELIIDTISSSMHAADNVNKMALKLYDGYNSGKGVLAKAELPEYLKKIETLAKLAVNGNKFAAEGILSAVSVTRKYVEANESPALKAAYRELLDCAEQFKFKALNRAIHVAIEEKTRYYAERIARTESVRAWFDGHLAENQDNDDVWGYRWVLSSRHHLVGFDQCDVIANMDVGFGAGIYPKNKVPSIPRHPHCMCMTEFVFSWEVKNLDRKINPNKAKKYINGLSEYQKRMIFGADGAKKYEKGEDWQKLLYGWDGFRKPLSRLSKDDFEKEIYLEKKMKKNLCPPSDEFIQQLANARGLTYTKGKIENERFYSDDGKPIYPPNDGAIGEKTNVTLKAGETLLSRYGLPTGRYISYSDVSFEQRAMPRNTKLSLYTRYRVIKDIESVERSVIAAWFGHPGGGIQYKLPLPIYKLTDFLKEVKDDDD